MSLGVPDWAEWYADDVKQYISGVEYDRIKAFEPWRLSRIVSITQFKNEEQGGVSRSQVMKDSKKGYNDYPYIRSKVTNRDIVEAVREVLGFKEGEAIPLVFDGKVTPVVVLNDYSFSNWKLVGFLDVGRDCISVDNLGVRLIFDFVAGLWKFYDKNNEKLCDVGGSPAYYSTTGNARNRNGGLVVVDDYPDIVVYRNGVYVWSVKLSDVWIDVNNIVDTVCMSANGKYINVSVSDVGGNIRHYLFEGVV